MEMGCCDGRGNDESKSKVAVEEEDGWEYDGDGIGEAGEC